MGRVATEREFPPYKPVMITLNLAQVLADSPVARLPDPPAAAYYLLESPWGAIAGVLALGVLAMFVLRKSGKSRLGGIVLGACAAVAGAVWLTARLVTTEREVLRERTRELVSAAAHADTGSLRPMLTEQARLGAFLPVVPEMRGRESLLDAVRKYPGQEVPLASHRTGPVQAVLDGPSVARTQVRVWVEPKEKVYGTDPGSWWRIDWRREPAQGEAGEYGPWRVTDVTIMQLDGLGMNPQGAR